MLMGQTIFMVGLLFGFTEALSFQSSCRLPLDRRTKAAAFVSNDNNLDTFALFNTRDSRRYFLQGLVTTCLVVLPSSVAHAGIDPGALRNLPVEGDVSGASTRLRQVQAVQQPETDLVDVPYTELPSGVSYREYRMGKGDSTVGPGAKVAVEMTIRCKSFATPNEPGGIKYFSTKEDTTFNELAWTIGNGQWLPGLEDGMAGMRRGALRRIEIPSTQVYAARKANQLPLPETKNGLRAFDRLFKTDATLLFEVLVTRVK